MIKNLTKLGCHLVCCTYYLKIAHYLPHLIFWELTSLCGNRFNDQRTHLFGILPHHGVLMAVISPVPFLFVMNHHLAAATGEARPGVTSAISEMILTSVAPTNRGSGRQHGCLSFATDVPFLSSLLLPRVSPPHVESMRISNHFPASPR